MTATLAPHQLTSEAILALRPRTTWQPLQTPAMIRNNTSQIDLGTYAQPTRDGLRVIATIDLAADVGAGDWLHLSISRARRLPTWGDLVTARDALGYEERYFVQQLPPRRAWLSVHSYCLHLLHRLDQETVPRLLWADQIGATGESYEHGKASRP